MCARSLRAGAASRRGLPARDLLHGERRLPRHRVPARGPHGAVEDLAEGRRAEMFNMFLRFQRALM